MRDEGAATRNYAVNCYQVANRRKEEERHYTLQFYANITALVYLLRNLGESGIIATVGTIMSHTTLHRWNLERLVT